MYSVKNLGRDQDFNSLHSKRTSLDTVHACHLNEIDLNVKWVSGVRRWDTPISRQISSLCHRPRPEDDQL